MPAPFGPIKHNDCALSIVRLNSCKISILPYPAFKFFISRYFELLDKFNNSFSDTLFFICEDCSTTSSTDITVSAFPSPYPLIFLSDTNELLNKHQLHAYHF